MKDSQISQFSANFHNSNQGSVTTKYLLIGSGLLLALIITAVGFIFALREFNSARDDAAEETSSTTKEADDDTAEETSSTTKEAGDDAPITSEKMLEILSDMDITCEESDLDSVVDDISESIRSDDDYDETEHETNIDNLETQLRADYQGPYFVCSDATNNKKYNLITQTDDLLIAKLGYEYSQQIDPVTDEQVCEYADDIQKFYDIYAEIDVLAFDNWIIRPDPDDDDKTYHALLSLEALKAEFAKQNLTTKIPETIKVCG